MVQTVDELTVQYEENGEELVRELDKVILSKGAWATVLFRYQQWEKAKEAFSSDKFVIRRYQKVSGDYKPKSKFVISSADQARKIVDALQQWISE